jgi:hypothetical protein
VTEEAPMDHQAPGVMADSSAASANLTWAAFLAMTFVVVGLAGLFASYAAPLPLRRALARDAALDAALLAAHGPDPAAALAALRPRLAESADAILPPGLDVGGDIDARITAERAAMRERLLLEADVVSERTRWLLGVVTVMAAAFGVAILHISRRR